MCWLTAVHGELVSEVGNSLTFSAAAGLVLGVAPPRDGDGLAGYC
jgi:hypothetical protein